MRIFKQATTDVTTFSAITNMEAAKIEFHNSRDLCFPFEYHQEILDAAGQKVAEVSGVYQFYDMLQRKGEIYKVEFSKNKPCKMYPC